VHRWLIAALVTSALLGGCQAAPVSVDLEQLVQVAGLPLPYDWLPRTAERREGILGHGPTTETWSRDWSQLVPRNSYVGLHMWALRYSSPSQAREGMRDIARRNREVCARIDPAALFPYSSWADACVVCQNRQNHGMTHVTWRYRNIVVEANLQESASATVADISGLFAMVDRHLRMTLVPKSP
jgi:hypothetical protein